MTGDVAHERPNPRGLVAPDDASGNATDAPERGDRRRGGRRALVRDRRAYASYDAAENATVYVATELPGRDEWFSGGWTGNEYRQRIQAELLGPGTEWYLAAGGLGVDSGRYRD